MNSTQLVVVLCSVAVLISSSRADDAGKGIISLIEPVEPFLMILFTAPSKRCGENEVYLECGSECPPTCAPWRRRRTTICSSTCVAGCFCKVRYVRELSEGNCIRPSECRRILRSRGPEE
ncbi:venom peptide SjAPI-like [Ochlerotatus camptorhynchus]|uniref:venom peptide SjAPI-like n=1 Tax=Ochlerotatus camptorhynchus TaxID=644619 RepID=UPI0031D3A206